jgi:hypothetical protein
MSLSTRLSFRTAILLLVLSAASVQAQEATCRRCEVAQENCSVNCLGREGKAIGACLIGCDNAAALCACDEPATLNSEDFVERFGPQPGAQADLRVVTDFSVACHSTTPCGTAYGSCANWSTFTECGDPFCGPASACRICDEWGQCTAAGPAMKQNYERYRVCFNELGQSCTEYQRGVSTGECGC